MPSYLPGLLVALFVIVDLVVVSAVMSVAMDSIFGKLSKTFPGQLIDERARRKNFQSMSSGIMNFGLCVHIATDDAYLHLLPSAFLRLFRAKATSIPWDAVELQGKGKSKRWVDLKVAGVDLRLPAWILDDQVAGV
jgi:hypothetical protein